MILGGFDDSPHRMVAEMEPWVLCVDTWRWKLAPKPPHPDSSHPLARARCRAPVGRHRTAGCVLGGRLMVVHGGCPAQGASWLSDTAVLDLTTLTWRHVDVHVEGLENVRHKRIAGHTMDAMMCFGGCKRGSFGITPISKIEFLMFGPPPSGVVAEQQERTFREESMAAKRGVALRSPVRRSSSWTSHAHLTSRDQRSVRGAVGGSTSKGTTTTKTPRTTTLTGRRRRRRRRTTTTTLRRRTTMTMTMTLRMTLTMTFRMMRKRRDEESASSDDSDEEERSDSDSDSDSDWTRTLRLGEKDPNQRLWRVDLMRLRTVLDEVTRRTRRRRVMT